MNLSALLWFFLNLISLIMLSYYSMMEMACVSFSRVRLQYEANQGNKKALRLSELLQNSSKLFGTTLIGVNVAMMFGSEFSRQFHSSLGISPEWAPLSQVMIVIVFGELAPMFAARRFPECTVRVGINLLWLSSKLMAPFLWAIRGITQLTHLFIGGRDEGFNIYLNQEEIKKIIEETPSTGVSEELNSVVSNIFNLRNRRAYDVMHALKEASFLPSNLTIDRLRQQFSILKNPFHIIYHRKKTQIIGVVHPRDLLKHTDQKRMADCAKRPWFISKRTKIMEILHQFRHNKQSVAIVLNDAGRPCGFITLKDLITEIFGKETAMAQSMLTEQPKAIPLFEKTFPGEMRIDDFNREYNVNLDPHGQQTLSELMTTIIGHHPEKGESIFIPPFELQAKESTLLDVKWITIKTRVT